MEHSWQRPTLTSVANVQLADTIKPIDKIDGKNRTANQSAINAAGVLAQLLRNEPADLVIAVWASDANEKISLARGHDSVRGLTQVAGRSAFHRQP